MTVEGRFVLGQAKFERDAPNIRGTVNTDGTFGATIGFEPVWGQFTRDVRIPAIADRCSD